LIEEELARRMSKEVFYFIVTSHGWSGSFWLANALDTHPEITCAHSALNIHSRGGDSSQEFLKKSMKTHGQAVLGREKRSIDELLDQVRSYCTDERSRFFGNVHTLRIRDLPALQEAFPVPRQHVLMNLVRHPVSVVASGYGQLRSFLAWDIYTLFDVVGCIQEQVDFAIDLAERYELNLRDIDVQAFLAACHHQKFLARDHQIAPDAPTILMERATTERDYFSEVVGCLTSGMIECDDKYLDQVFSIPALNRHVSEKKPDPAAQYLAWNPWQREAYKYSLEKFRLADFYVKYNYDFSFVR
jgi:hypothetical protein